MTDFESASLLDFLVAELLAERRQQVPQLGSRDEAVAILSRVKLHFTELKCSFPKHSGKKIDITKGTQYLHLFLDLNKGDV